MPKFSVLTETQLSISGTGYLRGEYGAEGAVMFNFSAFDGCAPTNGYVFGNRELLDEAWHAERSTLVIFGMGSRVKVIGMVEPIGAVIIDSTPVFRALVALTKRTG
jgi:hypothetical protein